MQRGPSLYLVNALIVMDNTGTLIYCKNYNDDDDNALKPTKATTTTKFLKSLHTHIQSNEQNKVCIIDGHLIIFDVSLDVYFVVVGSLDVNELMLEMPIACLIRVMNALLKPQVDRQTILDNYGILCLAIDEIIDKGIILQTDSGVIVDKLGKKAPSLSEMKLDEQSLGSAFSFAKQQLKTFLK